MVIGVRVLLLTCFDSKRKVN